MVDLGRREPSFFTKCENRGIDLTPQKGIGGKVADSDGGLSFLVKNMKTRARA
jgi:hypothetical protein